MIERCWKIDICGLIDRYTHHRNKITKKPPEDWGNYYEPLIVTYRQLELFLMSNYAEKKLNHKSDKKKTNYNIKVSTFLL